MLSCLRWRIDIYVYCCEYLHPIFVFIIKTKERNKRGSAPIDVKHKKHTICINVAIKGHQTNKSANNKLITLNRNEKREKKMNWTTNLMNNVEFA